MGSAVGTHGQFPTMVTIVRVHSLGHLWMQVLELPCPVLLFFFFPRFAFSRAAPTACGGSQARDLIGAAATGLHQSHSNVGSELCLQPTPQLTATPDP